MRIKWGVDKKRHEGAVGVDREGLREKIGEVMGAFAPINTEMTLADAVANPVEPHIHGLAAAGLDGVVGETDSALVVAKDERVLLGVAHISEDSTEGFTMSGVDEEGAVLCFGSGGDNDIEQGADDEEGAVDLRGLVAVAEVRDAADDRAGIGAGKVRGIGLDVEDHVAGAEDHFIGWMGARISEEAVGGIGDGDGGLGLGRGQRGDSGDHGVIDHQGVVEHASHNLLELVGGGGG